MKFKKTLPLYMILLLITVLFFSALPIYGEADIYKDVIRLHILAASDSAEEQALKIKVRDAILEKYGTSLSGYADRDAAAQELQQHLPAIQALAKQVLEENGSPDDVAVSLTTEYYDTRIYRNFRMPAGKYLSLSVKIGEASGQNFFCVLFPPLCNATAVQKEDSDPDAVLEVGLSPAEYRMITGDGENYKVRFRILEVLSALLE